MNGRTQYADQLNNIPQSQRIEGHEELKDPAIRQSPIFECDLEPQNSLGQDEQREITR